MFSEFVVHRPVLSGVISIVILIAGLVCMVSLPVSLYPDITPPTVTVTAVYPGADAQTLADTVAQPIEDQINGVEGMSYMSSNCAADGTYTLTVTFEVGRDLDMCQVLVQNRVGQAEPNLPREVTDQGVTTEKKSTQFVIMLCLTGDPEQGQDDVFLSNYATINIQDSFSRIPGVGDVQIVGSSDYSMRIWLKPDQLKYRGLSVDDVISAIRAQNIQVAAGTVGQPPVPKNTPFQYTVTCQGRLISPEEFEEIILKVGDAGQTIRVGDIATAELGAKTYANSSYLNGQPTAIILVYQLPSANTIQVSDECVRIIKEKAKLFPDGLDYVECYNGAWYINASIKQIYITLLQAVGLVVLIVFVFLQDWRAAIIPTLCIPVALIGTFAAMQMMGFSINTVTLFGLILAIGVVVDDSIVVVENTQRHIDAGMDPKQASITSMNEVIGPCIATTLTLLAVFVPTAFMPGLTGSMYRQFALTVSASTVISTINALTLSPVLCSLLLRQRDQNKKKFIFFRGFDWVFGRVEDGFYAITKRLVRVGLVMLLLFVGVCGLMYYGFMEVPTGFLPVEDQGYYMADIQLPDAASMQRTEEVSKRIGSNLKKLPGVDYVAVINGMSFLTGANVSNYASAFVFLKQWDQRTKPEDQFEAIIDKTVEEFAKVQEASSFPIIPPAIQGIGNSGGFTLELEDTSELGVQVLQQVADDIVEQARTDPMIAGVFSTFRANVPQVYIEFEKTKIMTMGLDLSSVYNTLQGQMGSIYVNDFNQFGRTYQVNIQADSMARARVEDIGKLWQANKFGNMVPLSTITEVSKRVGPQVIYRYNMYPATMISGSPAPGVSSGEAMTRIVKIAEQNMPPDRMQTEWTGMSYQQMIGGDNTVFIFILGAVFVFLFLAAQYESFLLPIAVLMSVPFALAGALALTAAFGLPNGLYTQIGIVILIGLASKTAILIVEFAKQKHDHEGMDRWTAAAEASKQRFRAILMTAFSDIFGWLPLIVATGAGAASRVSLGVAVVGGMLVACTIGMLFVPCFYVLVQGISDRMNNWKAPEKPDAE